MSPPRLSAPLAVSLNAGLLAGVLTGIAANFAHVAFGVPQGLYFHELAPLGVFTATLPLCLVLALVWRALSARPAALRTFGLLLAIGAVLATALVGLAPGPAHFLRVMLPLHAVVALGAFLIIPRATRVLAE